MWLDHHHKPNLHQKGKKIACLVPSLTQLLIDLGLENQLVARTKFCIHPEEIVSRIPKVGGTKQVNVQKLKALTPDLVIGNKEENTKSDLTQISQFAPVYVSDIVSFNDLKVCLQELNKYIPELSSDDFIASLDNLTFQTTTRPCSVAYLIWMNPMMVAGRDTYINFVLEKSGFINIFSDKSRYPEISEAQLIEKKPDYIFLSSEPFPFREKHRLHFEKLLPETRVLLVDGEIFSWYGIPTLEIPQYVTSLLET